MEEEEASVSRDARRSAVDERLQAEVLRLLDANINRATEGLRTIEDVCRLVWEDRGGAQWAKMLRHQLAAICQAIPRDARLKARSASTDSGANITVESERSRRDWGDVVSAAAERVSQSLRGLEEFSKFQSASLSAQFKRLRYEAYDGLAAVELRLQARLPPLEGPLMVLMDCALDLDAFTRYLGELAAAGVDYFQLRDKSADGGRLVMYAKAAVNCLAETRSRLLVNDRIDVALASGAAGVHVGQEDLTLSDARRLGQGKLWIGVSTHNMEQALRAESGGADYIGCGPTFASRTKQFEEFAGVEFLRDVAASIGVPAFAIGGVDGSNVRQVITTGIKRVAVSAAIHSMADPAQAARDLSRQLRASKEGAG